MKRKAGRNNRVAMHDSLSWLAQRSGWLSGILLILLFIDCASAQQGPATLPGFQVEPISADGADERLTVRRQGSTAVLEVVSQVGIGRARLLAASGGWPGRVLVRLHLQALEGFQAWNGGQRFFHALRHEDNVRRHRLLRQGRQETGRNSDPGA